MALIFTCLWLRIKSGSPAVYKSASSGSRKKWNQLFVTLSALTCWVLPYICFQLLQSRGIIFLLCSSIAPKNHSCTPEPRGSCYTNKKVTCPNVLASINIALKNFCWPLTLKDPGCPQKTGSHSGWREIAPVLQSSQPFSTGFLQKYDPPVSLHLCLQSGEKQHSPKRCRAQDVEAETEKVFSTYPAISTAIPILPGREK